MIELLYQALEADQHGIKVATEDVEALRQKLYRLRKDNDMFESLSLVPSPTNPEGELWIVRKK